MAEGGGGLPGVAEAVALSHNPGVSLRSLAALTASPSPGGPRTGTAGGCRPAAELPRGAGLKAAWL